MKNPMLILNIVNFQEYHLIVDVVQSIIDMLENKNH
jgi:hypothetical protein